MNITTKRIIPSVAFFNVKVLEIEVGLPEYLPEYSRGATMHFTQCFSVTNLMLYTEKIKYYLHFTGGEKLE